MKLCDLTIIHVLEIYFIYVGAVAGVVAMAVAGAAIGVWFLRRMK